MSIPLTGSLVLVGAGKMGGAMLEGWLRSGADPARIAIIDPAPPPEIGKLIQDSKLRFNAEPGDVRDCEIVVIAVKPQSADEALSRIAALKSARPLVLSVVAGKRIGYFEKYFGADAAVVRSMPNTPAAVGRGITAMAANRNVTAQQKVLAEALLSAVGEVVTVSDEMLLDAVTAVSGSGPAYVFYLTECMTEAGKKLGLSEELATELARATVAGAGELMMRSGLPASTLRQNVTSPKGTTYAALKVLMRENGMMALFEEALREAARRSRELAG
jgi:pyrroline-5-carboxylate reductase